MTLIFILAATKLAEPMAETIYFLVRDSADITANTLSDIIAITGGMPGDVELHVIKPSYEYQYIIGFSEKLVRVDAMGGEEIELPEEIKSSVFSGIGTEIDNIDCKSNVFSKIIIEKSYDDGLNIKVEC